MTTPSAPTPPTHEAHTDVSATSCCLPEYQAVCCEPAAKAECCGSDGKSTGCGC
jgi:hypothetical protein